MPAPPARARIDGDRKEGEIHCQRQSVVARERRKKLRRGGPLCATDFDLVTSVDVTNGT